MAFDVVFDTLVWFVTMLRILVLVCLGLTFGRAAEPEPFARIGSSNWLHRDHPNTLAMHPSGKVVVSGGADGLVRIWDVATGKVLHTIIQKGLVVASAFSADGRRLAVHFSDELVRLYETEHYAEKKSVAVRTGDLLSLSRDGKLLVASGALGQPVLLETENGQDRMELPKGRVAAIRPDGGAVAVATQANTLQVLEIPSGKPLFEVQYQQNEAISHLAFGGDGQQLAVAWAGEKAKIQVYEVGKDQPHTTVSGSGPVCLREDIIIGIHNNHLAVWQLKTGKLLHTLGDGVSLLDVSADGELAVTDGGREFPSPRISLWDLKTGEIRNRAPGDIADLQSLLLSPTGEAVITSTAGLLRWQPGVTEPKLLAGIPRIRTSIVAGSRLLAVTDTNKLIDADSPKKTITDLPAEVRFLAADRSGQQIALVTSIPNPELLLVNVETGVVKRRWLLPARPLGVALAPDSKLVAVVGRDGFTRVWNTTGSEETPAELWKERTARSFRVGIAFSPDGSKLAVTSLMRVSVQEAETGKRLFQFDRAFDDGPFTTLAFSPDGRFLAASTQGSRGGAVIWELLTQQRAEHYPAEGTVTGLLFLDQGQTLLTLGADDQVKVWDRSTRRGQHEPTADDLAKAWQLLGNPNPEQVFPAIATLGAGNTRTLAFMRERLAEEKKITERIHQWIGELDSREFAVRELAMKELIAIGGVVLPALEKAEKTPHSAEWNQRAATIRTRITSASESLPDPTLAGRTLAWVRAIAALEQLATPESDQLLNDLRLIEGWTGREASRILTARRQRMEAKPPAHDTKRK